jgi:hypothetical protein
MTEYKLTARERADAVIKAMKEGDVSIDDLVRIALDDQAAFLELLSDCLPDDELEIAILGSLEEMETCPIWLRSVCGLALRAAWLPRL